MNDLSSQRMLSLWLRRFSTDRIAKLRESPDGRSAPLVVTSKRGNVEILTAIDDAAEKLGLLTGMALAQARAMRPGKKAVPEDIEAECNLARLNRNLVSIRYTPLVACDDAPDGLLLDISGCAHLHGGEHKLVARSRRPIRRAALPTRFAIAGTIGTTSGCRAYGEPGEMFRAKSAHCSCYAPLRAAASRP